MNGRSLTGSLGQSLSLGLILVMLLQWFLVTRVLQEVTLAYVRSRLGHDAESLLAALEISPEGLPLLDPRRLNPTFSRPYSGHYYLLRIHQLELASRSLWTQSLPLSELPAGSSLLSQTVGPRQQPLLVLQQGLHKGPLHLQLAVAEDLSQLKQALVQFNLLYGLGSGLLLLLLLSLQYWLIRRLLSPLLRTQAEIQQLEGGLEGHLNESVPAELQPLVQAFNRLLTAQQQRLNRSRHSLSDLSHALKRPLTRIRQLLEDRPWPELADEVTSIGQQIEHQLAKARLAGQSPVMTGLPLEALLQELVPVLSQLYADKSLHFQLQIPASLKLRMDRQDALELIGTLLDNACKWARHQVAVTARLDQGLALEISDDGPGAPPELLEKLTLRGVRADQQMPGHGLGLAIARDLVESYGGQIELGRSDKLQGFRVSIYLPGQGLSG